MKETLIQKYKRVRKDHFNRVQEQAGGIDVKRARRGELNERIEELQEKLSTLEAEHSEAVAAFAVDGKGTAFKSKRLEIEKIKQEIKDLQRMIPILDLEILRLEGKLSSLKSPNQERQLLYSIRSAKIQELTDSMSSKIHDELWQGYVILNGHFSEQLSGSIRWPEYLRKVFIDPGHPQNWSVQLRQAVSELLGDDTRPVMGETISEGDDQ